MASMSWGARPVPSSRPARSNSAAEILGTPTEQMVRFKLGFEDPNPQTPPPSHFLPPPLARTHGWKTLSVLQAALAAFEPSLAAVR